MQEHGVGRGVRVVSASGGAPFLYHYLLSGHIKTKHYDFSARSTTHLKIWSSAERPISGGCSAASGQYKVLWLVWGADQRASERQSHMEGQGSYRLEGTDVSLEGRASTRLPTRPRLSCCGMTGSRNLREAAEGYNGGVTIFRCL